MFSKPLVTAAPDHSLGEIARQMEKHNVGTVVIEMNEKPVGIITDRDLALALGAKRLSPDTAVSAVMTEAPLTIPDDAGIFMAAKRMREYEVRRLPIVNENDQLVGIVTMDDLLQLLGREFYNLSEAIRPELAVK
jgi:CBS domain-containing protein